MQLSASSSRSYSVVDVGQDCLEPHRAAAVKLALLHWTWDENNLWLKFGALVMTAVASMSWLRYASQRVRSSGPESRKKVCYRNVFVARYHKDCCTSGNK